jgi:hypothetical protein
MDKELNIGTAVRFEYGVNPEKGKIMHGTIIPMPHAQMSRFADTHYCVKPSPVHPEYGGIAWVLVPKDEVVTG